MYRIGVDIGGTGIQAGLVNEEGKIVAVKECKTDVKAGFEKVVQDMKGIIYALLEEKNLTEADITKLGFGVPSSINQKGQVTCVNLGWKEVDFVPTLKKVFDKFDVAADNDATVAGVAEAHYGSMKGYPYAVLITLGTGVGAGIIVNGKPFSGAFGRGSEIGHIIIGENFYGCNCGNNGCFETFCSATGIIKYAQKLIAEGAESSILEAANGDASNINAKMVFDAYREGDKVAIDTITRFKKYLAIGIADIINFMDPHIIAIGGGVSRAHDVILDGLKEEVKKYIMCKNEQYADIVVATLGNDAGIIGAACL